jgi:leucyl aminopeptidase (aminopeptidase T)
MPYEDKLLGARKLLSVCVRVQPGEDILIITDDAEMQVAGYLAQAANEVSAVPTICLIPIRAAHGQEPPTPVAAALRVADVFFTPVRVSITHTQAIKEAACSGARGLVMTAFTPEMLVSGGIEADFRAQAPICKSLAERFESGKRVHLTAPGGTDLYLDATGRRGNALTGLVEAGQFSTTPTIEANFSPLEGSAQGVIVADASIPYLEIGVLEQPVRATVCNGYVTGIDGGAQAEILRQNLAAQRDRNVYNVAELGVGLNPKSRLCGLMLEDEGVLGLVHIGIGTNVTLGGTIKAKTHYDLIIRGATLTVDGEVVLRDGALV